MADPRAAGGEAGAFRERAEATLARLERAIDDLADDFDIDVLRAGNVVTLTFETGHKIIVNTQEAAGEIWVAARSGGFHYRWDEAASQWRDTRSSEDLRVALGRLVGDETGTTPTLAL
jgi:CyaY protein